MSKIKLDQYFTEENVARHCVEKTFEVLGQDWDRIIEPSAGEGVFLKFLPPTTIAYDISPKFQNTITADYRQVELPYMERSLVIGNCPFGRANKLSVQFVKASLRHSPYISFIQPISQLGQNRTMTNTELLYSEDLGTALFSGRSIHCCLNIYHYCEDGHKHSYDIEGITECRHIFRSGKDQHSDELLNKKWDFRVAAWGRIRLLEDDEFCPNEVVLMVDDDMKDWVREQLQKCDFRELVSCVSTPNLPAWRLKKWLWEQYTLQSTQSMIKS